MPGAGELNQQIGFQQKALDDEGFRLGPWDEDGETRRWAKITWLRGGEGVLAQRLQGSNPCVLTVRADVDTRAVTSAWRAMGRAGEIDGKVFNLKSANPAKEPGFIDILATVDGTDV